MTSRVQSDVSPALAQRHPCEEAGLPYSIIHLCKLKIHATWKGNVHKEAITAAAKARFGLDLADNAADALWASAYALDHNLFS